MSGVSAVNYLLSNSAGVTALVPAASIVSGGVPLPIPLPSIAVAQVSDTEVLDVSMNGKRMVAERVQVTAYAATYAAKKAILAAVRSACVGQKGSFNGIAIDSVLPGGSGPDLDDPGIPLFEQSRDFIVRWLSSTP